MELPLAPRVYEVRRCGSVGRRDRTEQLYGKVEKRDRRVGISLIDRPMRVTIDLQHRDAIRQHPPRH